MSRAGRIDPTRPARHSRSIGRTRPGGRRATAAVTVAALAAIVAAVVAQWPRGPYLPDAINGRYVGFSVPGFPPSEANLARLVRRSGVRPNLVSLYTAVDARFHTRAVRAIDRQGALPLIQVDPVQASLASIAAGRQDAWLRSYAQAAKRTGRPLAIGLAHEFNGTWSGWSYNRVPARVFVSAWRRMVTVFRRAGAANVIWVWTITVSTPGTGPLASYWPGARYVNWVGMDGYFYGPRTTFAGTFGPTISRVRRFTAAPLLITETAAIPAGRVGRIENLFAGAASTPGLIGLIWFDYNKPDGHTWNINSDPAALTAFHRAAAAYWQG